MNEAAVRILGGKLVSRIDAQNCPGGQLCVVAVADLNESARRGLAAVEFGDALSGAILVLGRTPAGTWDYVDAVQQFVRPYRLPASTVVCSVGGLNVRSEAALTAAVVTTIPDGAAVAAEEFVLTGPGLRGEPRRAGEGWYRISSPAAGWVASKYLNTEGFPCPPGQ